MDSSTRYLHSLVAVCVLPVEWVFLVNGGRQTGFIFITVHRSSDAKIAYPDPQDL